MDKALSRKNGVDIKSTVEYIRGITLLPCGFQMNARTQRSPARARDSAETRERESGEARACARATPDGDARDPPGRVARPVRPGVAPWPARRGLYSKREESELSVLADSTTPLTVT